MIYHNKINEEIIAHTHNSLSAEASNVEVIYSNDDHYELIVEQPTSKVKEGDTDSMCGNSAYELTDQGEGAEVTPTTREDFGLARNDSYEALDVRTENLYEQPTSTEKEDDTNSMYGNSVYYSWLTIL